MGQRLVIKSEAGVLSRQIFSPQIEEDSAERGLSPQIMKIELASISATESLFLHSVKVS